MLTTKRRPSRSVSESKRLSRSSMKKNYPGPLVAILIIVIVAVLYGYMYYQNNRQEKKILELQKTVVENSQTVSAVVGFINNNMAQAQAEANK